MIKFPTLIFLVILACLLGGVYGILHDQLTYTISAEYYTKFKFVQFGFIEEGKQFNPVYPRAFVAQVGFMASWWMGIPIGILLGLVGLIHTDYKQMFRITKNALLITLAVAFVTGLIGLWYGFFVLAVNGVNWWLPENLVHRENFIAVGSMHNCSYLGGVIGLVFGILYSIWKKYKNSVT
jgi:hypothetical protein